MRPVFFIVLLISALLSAACASEGPDRGSSGTTPEGSGTETTGATEPTMTPEATEGTTPSEATLGPSPEEPDAVLRLEGASGTRFSGTCAVGNEETVIRGQVPQRFTYQLDGQRLVCRIEKRDAGGGALKVILSAGGSTRSVQQTNTRGGTVEISYRSSR